MADDREAGQRRADELQRAIEEATRRPPATPREFTDREARETASRPERERPDAED
jgi:hypothetical protein